MRKPLLIYLATLCVLGATWWEMRRGIETEPWPLVHPLDSIPMEWQGQQATPATISSEELEVLLPTSYLMRTYGSDVQLLISYFATQRIGKSMHSPKNCLPGAGWEVVESRILQINESPGAPPTPINLYRIRSGENALMMLYWYQSPGYVVASEVDAKLHLFWDRFHFSRSPGSIVRLTLADKPESLEKGLNFAKWLLPEMRRCVGSLQQRAKTTAPSAPVTGQSLAQSASAPTATP